MHGGNLRLAQERYGRKTFIDLSANINPFGPPPGVWQALQEGMADIVHYPDTQCKELIEALAARFGLPQDWIIAGNGAGELIFNVVWALRPRQVLIPLPAFSEYERAARAWGANVRHLPLGAGGWQSLPGNGSSAGAASGESPASFERDREVLQAFWSKSLRGGDMVFLCTPHNPTGSAMTPLQLETALEAAAIHNCTVVVDESFYDFLPDAERWSARRYLHECRHLIVLYSLTKFYSIPGLRLGAAFAHPETIQALNRVRDPWSVNCLAQRAGVLALKDDCFADAARERLAAAKAYFYAEFARRSFPRLTLLPTTVNFALIELREWSASEFTDQLARRGVLVRDCSNFQSLPGNYVRVAIKDIPSMKAFLDAVELLEKDESRCPA